jgi:hypothetical protein
VGGKRNFYKMAVMDAFRVGSIAPMTEARASHGFNAEEERCFCAMQRIAPKWGWPSRWERVWTIEDQRRYGRYASDPFNERTE